MDNVIPRCFYRVSTKGLVVRDGKILLVQEKDGRWELPGGGLEFDQEIFDSLKREFVEEMGVNVTKITERPIYVWKQKREKDHRLFIAYKVEIDSLDFTKSDECTDIKFFSKKELKDMNLHINIQKFAELFNPEDFKL
ncbi:MAG: NUDIX hydrolase [Patescibacteria group bacterium]|nr:NUDIX hydrolase [Patescibacteria group bacterium]